MAAYIQRDVYLQKLIDSRLNGDVKVVTDQEGAVNLGF